MVIFAVYAQRHNVVVVERTIAEVIQFIADNYPPKSGT